MRRVVTLGSPHRGNPAALVGVLFLGAVSRAVWQMLPGSPFLRELAALPVPEGSEIVAVAAGGDALVPARFACIREGARQLNELAHTLTHLQFLASSTAFGLIGQLLR